MQIDPKYADFLDGNIVLFDTPRDIVKELKEIDEQHLEFYGTNFFDFKEWENYHKLELTSEKVRDFAKQNGYMTVNCTPCQGHFYLFVLGNVCLSTLQLTIPSNG